MWLGCPVRCRDMSESVCIRLPGVDYMHPDLGGGFGPGFKVAYGYDFVGDAGGARTDGSMIAYPDNDPRDTCNGALKQCKCYVGYWNMCSG